MRGGDGNGRIRIQLDPEVVPEVDTGLDRAPDTPDQAPTDSVSEKNEEIPELKPSTEDTAR